MSRKPGNLPASPDILFEDDDLLVVNKPPGLLVIPDRYDPALPNLRAMMQDRYGRIFIVHRLDRGTSGIVLMAKTPEAHRSLSLQFENRSVRKRYLALVEGRMEQREGMIELPLSPSRRKQGMMEVDRKNGKEALTAWAVQEEFAGFTLLEVELLTGRQHQVRVHLKALGHPLAVDRLYGNRQAIYLSEIKRTYKRSKDHPEQPLIARETLHAKRLEFTHPQSEERMYLEAPLAKDFHVVIRALRKYGKNQVKVRGNRL